MSRRGSAALPALRPVIPLLVLLPLLLPVSSELSLAQETAGEPVVLRSRVLTGPRADVAALLLAANEGGSLWAAGLAVPTPVAADRDPPTARVDFWLELDGARLLAEAGLDDLESLAEIGGEPPETLRLELHAYAVTRNGELAGALSRRVALSLAEHGERLRRGGIQLVAGFDLPAGEYELRALVRETRSQRFVLRLATVIVPSAVEPFLGPPWRPAPPLAWIAVRDLRPRDVEGATREAPAALPVIFDRGPSQFELEARLPAGTPLTARLLDGEGEEVARPTLDPDRWPGGEQKISLAVTLDELAPGPYRLELSTDGGLASGARIAVLPAGISEGEVVWTGVDRLERPAAAPGEEIGPELEAERRARGRIRAIAKAYRQVIEVLASGAIDDAIDQLDAMESEVLASGESRGDALEWLVTAEERVARRLARHDPETLLPLMVLHLEVYSLYDSRNIEPLRLIATRRRMRDLAEVYGSEGDEEMSRRLAATVLAEAGIAIDRHNMPQEARRMLEAAFALDDGNSTQLLYLGYWYERRGYYEEAIVPLKRLVEVDSAAHEGRLRLALCLHRLGRSGEAERLLRDLLIRGAEPWHEQLAYQELARLLLLEDRTDEAVRLLEQAVARHPEHQRLHLQWLYALERDDSGHRVAEVLRRLPADDGRLSARNLYSRRPRSTVDGARATLRRHVMGRLPVLAAALSELEDEP